MYTVNTCKYMLRMIWGERLLRFMVTYNLQPGKSQVNKEVLIRKVPQRSFSPSGYTTKNAMFFVFGCSHSPPPKPISLSFSFNT